MNASDINVGTKGGEEMVYRFNKEVEFDENNNGTIKIDWYSVEHELYPVQKSWCIETDI